MTVDTEYLWNIHKYNPGIYKLDSISWQNWYILGAQVDMTLETQQNRSQYNSRVHNHFNRCRKSIWKKLTPFKTKTSGN